MPRPQGGRRSVGPGRDPSSWSHGIERAYQRDEDIFITPPVDGWILVVGVSPEETPEETHSNLERLSAIFSEAQYFATDRVVEYHAWARAAAGTLMRYYAYLGEAGEVLAAVGEPTPIEISAGIPAGVTPDEELVMRVAGGWSVDPSRLEERSDLAPGFGLLVTRRG